MLRDLHPESDISGIAFDAASEERWMPNLPWAERIGNATSRSIFGRGRQLAGLAVTALIATSRAFLPLRFFLPRRQRLAVDLLRDADLAISCPGGYLEDSNSAYVVNLLSILLAARLSKQVVLAPQSIGPVHNSFGRWLMRRAMRAADRIFVRERESLIFIGALFPLAEREMVLGKVQMAGDLAFWFHQQPTGSLEAECAKLGITPTRKLLGLTVVDWNFPHAADPQAARANYIESLSALIRHVEARQSHQIVIFNQVAHDLELAREIGRRHPGVIVDTLERDAGVLSKLIGLSDIFIGTRFHSCIFALVENVTTVAIAYLPKTSGIMQDLELDDLVVDVDSISGDQLIRLFERVAGERDAVQSRISANLEIYRRRHDGFLRYLANRA
ncbi:MAG: polysaccharide pyruvyl transferase family protein [Acidobacteriota bacterium]|nr:polysaccharide pyruvyl transferase family protein [Acidobacteriota bacterium]